MSLSVERMALEARENKTMEIKVKWELDHVSMSMDENTRWSKFMMIVHKAGDDQYTHVDGIPKLLRQLIVKIANETGAEHWEYTTDRDLLTGEQSYIVFYYDFKPARLTEKERIKLNQEIKQIAVANEGVCEHFEYMHHENVVKKCENCFFYGFWGSTPVCYRNEEKLAELVPIWYKVDKKGKSFQTKKSVEIHLIVESFAENILKGARGGDEK